MSFFSYFRRQEPVDADKKPVKFYTVRDIKQNKLFDYEKFETRDPNYPHIFENTKSYLSSDDNFDYPENFIHRDSRFKIGEKGDLIPLKIYRYNTNRGVQDTDGIVTKYILQPDGTYKKEIANTNILPELITTPITSSSSTVIFDPNTKKFIQEPPKQFVPPPDTSSDYGEVWDLISDAHL